MSNLEQVLRNFEKAKNDVIVELSRNVNLAGIHYEGKVKENTPVRKGDLHDSIITGDVKNVGGKISVDVGTNLEYAPYVEFGVKSKKFQYHKGMNVFKEGVGARMFRDTLKEEQNTIKSIIIYGG